MTIKTIFLDRDGVINKDIGYLHKIDEFEFIDGIFEICDYLSHMDYKIIILNVKTFEIDHTSFGSILKATTI